MKKVLLIILVLASLTAKAQFQTYDGDPIYGATYSTRYLPFDKIGATENNYEIPYLRHCLKRSHQYRVATTFIGLASAGLLIYSAENPYIDKKYDQNLLKTTHVAYGFAGAALLTYVISEYWFRQSAVKPVIHDNGLGIKLIS